MASTPGPATSRHSGRARLDKALHNKPGGVRRWSAPVLNWLPVFVDVDRYAVPLAGPRVWWAGPLNVEALARAGQNVRCLPWLRKNPWPERRLAQVRWESRVLQRK